MKMLFSVNEYDYEGDISEKGIYLHVDGFRLPPISSLKEYDELIEQLQHMRKELSENCYRAGLCTKEEMKSPDVKFEIDWEDIQDKWKQQLQLIGNAFESEYNIVPNQFHFIKNEIENQLNNKK